MDETLRRLQLTQLELLKLVDRLCRKHNIHYSLDGGTLLGAVRHGGFIPWDDDLDVCMPREDYDRFIQIWLADPPKGYYIQNKDLNPAYRQSFTKIRKEHTTFLQNENEPEQYNPGIFIDIFPMDRIPSGRIKERGYVFRGYLYNLLMREYAPSQNGKATALIARVLLASIPRMLRPFARRRLLRQLTRYNDCHLCRCIGSYTYDSLKLRFPPSLLDEYDQIRFEDGVFMCFKDWDTYLRVTYGDYMQLPPESERAWRHHPIILDFEHDYEELKRLGKTDRIP